MLLTTLQTMRDRGNSIIVVEHDEETIRRGDYIIDLGPGGGRNGGQIIAAGSLEQITRSPRSLTGAYLNGRVRTEITSRRRSPQNNQWLRVLGARMHNLKEIDVGIPLGTLTCVTGVSGSGKSTFLKTTVLNGLKRLFGQYADPPGLHDTMEGWQHVDRVLEVDHSPIGKTPRSTPATYVGVFDDIRRLFAMTPEARVRGYGPGRFSFNVRGGRCEECAGQGTIRVQMQFLPDVYVECERCSGRRYNEDTLAVDYKGRDIHEVLDMTFEEGLRFFSSIPKIRRIAQMIVDLGLGYLTFGQPSPTLSGGEAQRIKLAAELGKTSKPRTFYVLDEPTTGLHPDDITKLLHVFQQLVDQGHTVVVIEHNMTVIKEADYIIDLGPEGGIEGGDVVAKGTPAELLSLTDRSYTARFLKEYLTS